MAIVDWEEIEETNRKNRESTTENAIRDNKKYVTVYDDECLMIGSADCFDDFCYILLQPNGSIRFESCLSKYEVVNKPRQWADKFLEDPEFVKKTYETIVGSIKELGRAELKNLEEDKKYWKDEEAWTKAKDGIQATYIDSAETRILSFGL